MRSLGCSLLVATVVSVIAIVLFAIAGYGLALGQPSPAALDRFRLLLGTMFMAVVAFDVTLVSGGIFRWRHTERVSWLLLAVAGLTWLIAAVSPMH